MKTKKQYMTELKQIQSMTNRIRTINESMSFADEYDDDDFEYGQDGEPQDAPAPEGMEQPQPHQQEVPGPQGAQPQQQEEAPKDENISKYDERITKIREACLDGLKQYQHNVDSEIYQFFKKVFLLADKAVSENESVGEGKA